jgi:RNA polymerase sigma factor (sigma-70 family)
MDSAAPNLDVLLGEAGWVRALAHSLVRDPAAADDVVQETWLAALRRPPDTTRPVRPWLARVVENFARMRMRGEAGRERREEGAARAESLASTEELCARVETQRLLALEVLALAEPFRSTIVLRYYEGLSAAEIARRRRAVGDRALGG